ncbi:putative 54S ribosomal protein L32, mitochondrial [Russula decolorans]
MAAITAIIPRQLLAISSAFFPSSSSSIFGSSWSIPLLPSLRDIIPPFILAVPKKKVSHSRKAMRSANKGLKDKQNLVHCPGCGSVKLAHHLCPHCYSSINRAWKSKSRSDGSASMTDTPS